MSGTNSTQRVFGAEALEKRTLLSVTVNYDGQKLEIIGDDQPDEVVVRTVGGLLLVNGVPRGPAAGLKDVVIKTHGGDDRIDVADVEVSNSLEIVAGGGMDNVRLGDLDGNRDVRVGNDVKIETNEGADRAMLTEVLAGDSLEVKTGTGNDDVDVNLITGANDVKIEAEDGNDTVRARNLGARNLVLLDGGSGFDVLLVVGVFTPKLEIKNFEVVV